MGVKAGEIWYFVSPDTGVSLPTKKIHLQLLQDLERTIRKQMPEPKPPLQKVDYGNGPVDEANLAEPGYVAAMDKWEKDFRSEQTRRTQELILKMGVYPALILSDEQKSQIKALREEMMEEYQIELDPDDRFVYVWNICLQSADDLNDLIQFMIRRSQPTEGAIQEKIKSFRG
jgi:hypothetical protein